MIAINYSTARRHLKEYCDKTVNDFETIIITRERGENIVLMSEGEYNNMLENLYVRSNQKDYSELLASIQQLKSGKGKVRDLVDDEKGVLRHCVAALPVLDSFGQKNTQENQRINSGYRTQWK